MDEPSDTPENCDDLLALALRNGLVSDQEVEEARKSAIGPGAVLAALVREGKLSNAEIIALSEIARGRARRRGESPAGPLEGHGVPPHAGEPVPQETAAATAPPTVEETLQMLRQLRSDLHRDGGRVVDIPEAERRTILVDWIARAIDMLQHASELAPSFRSAAKEVLDRLTSLLRRETGITGKSARKYLIDEWDSLVAEQTTLLAAHRSRLGRKRPPSPAFVPGATTALEAIALDKAEEEANLLAGEISSLRPTLPALPHRERNAQVSVWAGRFRRLQDRVGNPPVLPDALRTALDLLRDIGQTHKVGSIPALRRDFTADWDAFESRNEERLEQLRNEREAAERAEEEEAAARAEETRLRREEKALREAELDARRQDALDEIGAVLSRSDPSTDPSPFLASIRQGLHTLSPSDLRLRRLVEPHADLLVGKDFRRLRAKLKKGEKKRPRLEMMAEEEREVIAWTTGKRGVIVGGDTREEARARIEEFFGFASLEWRPAVRHDARQIQALAESVQSGGCDVVIVPIRFTGHHVQESLRKACKAAGIPFVFADTYGIRGIAKNLRRALGIRDGESDGS